VSLHSLDQGATVVKSHWPEKLIFSGLFGAALTAITPYALLYHSGSYFNPGEVRLLEFVVICIVLPGMTVPLALAITRALRYPHPVGCVCCAVALNLFISLVGSFILYGIAVI
jgi:hypothetical protein